jgi:hypothetical protein
MVLRLGEMRCCCSPSWRSRHGLCILNLLLFIPDVVSSRDLPSDLADIKRAERGGFAALACTEMPATMASLSHEQSRTG